MITHNEPLKDNLTDLINIVTVKANQYNDAELQELAHDVDWMRHKILSLEEDSGETEYDRGYEDGYEEAKEAMLNAL